MTYKYFDVRNDIFECCSDKELKGKRTFKEMKSIFNAFHWVIAIVMLISIASIIFICFSKVNDFFALIPFAIIYVCSIIYEYKAVSYMDKNARNAERNKHNEAYTRFVKSIMDVLERHEVNDEKKRNLLRKECLKELELHEKKYSGANNKIVDVLIGVPIGALISSFIYEDNNALVNKILAIVVIGIIAVYFVKIIKKISFYSEGYLKDQYMLDALDEVEYSLLNKQ